MDPAGGTASRQPARCLQAAGHWRQLKGGLRRRTGREPVRGRVRLVWAPAALQQATTTPAAVLRMWREAKEGQLASPSPALRHADREMWSLESVLDPDFGRTLPPWST